MTTRAAAREAVYERVRASWTVAYPAYPMLLDNEANEPTGVQAWIRVTVDELASRQQTLAPAGARRWERRGMVTVQVFTLDDTGRKLNDALSKHLADLFEGVSFSGLDFQAASARRGNHEHPWVMGLVTAQFTFYETH